MIGSITGNLATVVAVLAARVRRGSWVVLTEENSEHPPDLAHLPSTGTRKDPEVFLFIYLFYYLFIKSPPSPPPSSKGHLPGKAVWEERRKKMSMEYEAQH